MPCYTRRFVQKDFDPTYAAPCTYEPANELYKETFSEGIPYSSCLTLPPKLRVQRILEWYIKMRCIPSLYSF